METGLKQMISLAPDLVDINILNIGKIYGINLKTEPADRTGFVGEEHIIIGRSEETCPAGIGGCTGGKGTTNLNPVLAEETFQVIDLFLVEDGQLVKIDDKIFGQAHHRILVRGNIFIDITIQLWWAQKTNPGGFAGTPQ